MRTAKGTFAPGYSGNPGGSPRRSAFLKALRDKFGEDYKVIVDELYKIALESTNTAHRLRAIEIILDRGLGKPLQTQDITITSPEPITFFYLESNEEDKSE